MNDEPCANALERRQADSTQDLELICRYGEAHPDAKIEVRLENQPPTAVTAVIAGDHFEEHEAALRQLVSDPGRLAVRQPPPRTHLEVIRDKVYELATADLSVFRGLSIRDSPRSAETSVRCGNLEVLEIAVDPARGWNVRRRHHPLEKRDQDRDKSHKSDPST